MDFGAHAVLAPDEVIYAMDPSEEGSDMSGAGFGANADSAMPPSESGGLVGAAALREKVAGAKAAIDGMLSGGVDGPCG